jgi:eukaryotic-like serine/threonine-protein kinase
MNQGHASNRVVSIFRESNCSASGLHGVRVGGVISDVSTIGPYRLATRIAVGGMAEVFRALKSQSAGADRAVVIKRMLPALAAEPDSRAMFEHEAELGMAIRDPNVVQTLDRGVWDDAPFLVLEYVFGVDLARLTRWLSRERIRVPAPVAIWLTTQLLSGLDSVHTARDSAGAPLGIVHRDVSPSNVFLSVHGDVKLGDLGIAQALRDRRKPSATQSASARAKGKVGYLAPEQVSAGRFDARSDVFAAAVVGLELLLGHPLFSRPSPLEVLLAVREANVLPALAELDGATHPAVLRTFAAALERHPEQRVRSAGAMRLALLPHAGDPASCRRLVGEWVVLALDAQEEEDSVRRESLARTIERSPSQAPPRRTSPPPARLSTLPPPAAGASSLSETSVLSALERAIREGRTGVMTFRRGDVEKQLYLSNGAPLYVSSNQTGDLLGERLVRDGYLDRKALDLALLAMGPTSGLGETLVDLGLIDVFRAAANQVDDKLFELFTWEEGTVSFESQAPPPALAFPIGLRPAEILERARKVRQGST